MPHEQRVSAQQLIEAYRSTGNIWKAAKLLGVCGQSVHERLKRLGIPLCNKVWTEEENTELRALNEEHTIGEMANLLGRTYASVACQLSALGIRATTSRRRYIPKKLRIEGGKRKIQKLVSKFQDEHEKISLRKFCRENHVQIDKLAKHLQELAPDFWDSWAKANGPGIVRACEYCKREFPVVSKKQVFCSRKCATTKHHDDDYFYGNRRNTIGLSSGVCQLCKKKVDAYLSSHHIFGKEADPKGEHLIALCRGCHKIVEMCAIRECSNNGRFWEDLIHLALLKKGKSDLFHEGNYVCVEIEHLTPEDAE